MGGNSGLKKLAQRGVPLTILIRLELVQKVLFAARWAIANHLCLPKLCNINMQILAVSQLILLHATLLLKVFLDIFSNTLSRRIMKIVDAFIVKK
jgi:hypothetical protein